MSVRRQGLERRPSKQEEKRVPTVTDNFKEIDSTAAAIHRVRYRALTDLGVDPEEAAVMAANPELRLADVIDLVRRGFPAHTALRIVLEGHAPHPARSPELMSDRAA